MTYAICKREGEHETLEAWQSDHIIFFNAEGAEIGYEFSWEMTILFEDFAVIY